MQTAHKPVKTLIDKLKAVKDSDPSHVHQLTVEQCGRFSKLVMWSHLIFNAVDRQASGTKLGDFY